MPWIQITANQRALQSGNPAPRPGRLTRDCVPGAAPGQSPERGRLYLVRHGLASFGAADYDHLSAMGVRQSVRLGEYFAHKGVCFEAVITGTLRRHTQT